jgi:LppX_LprAFG lipoprotein
MEKPMSALRKREGRFMRSKFKAIETFYLFATTALIFSLSGCGGPENLPPDKILEKAVPAIQAVNSFHFTLETSKLEKPIPGIFITGVDGDVVKPDKLQGDISAFYSGIPVKVKVVVDGQSQYMTDPTSGRWGAMSSSFNVVGFFDPTKGVSDILANVKQLTGDGTESIEGTDAYRLKGMVPATALKALSPEVTATQDLTTTIWIGASDFLLRRVRLEGPILSDEPANIVRTITIKDYNKPAKVETPVVK